MNLLTHFIWSGRASLSLALASLIANLIAYSFYFKHGFDALGKTPAFEWSLAAAGLIGLSLLCSIQVIFYPPAFQRPRAALIRIALSTNVAVAIGCVYFYAGIIALFLLKRVD